MIALITDTTPSIVHPLLSGKDGQVVIIRVTSPFHPPFLYECLMKDDLELVVIECHKSEKTCLPLINTVKQRRIDIPVIFVISSDTTQPIVDAFKRGARDCFKTPFDLTSFKRRVTEIRSVNNRFEQRRMALALLESEVGSDHAFPSDLPDGIARVITYIEDNAFDRSITVVRLARIAGISNYHFCRTFKKHTNHSPMQFVTRIRVDAAKRLLKHCHRKMTVAQIADSTGFYDASNLNRHFKRLTGLTPKQFALSHRPSLDPGTFPRS